MSGWESSGVCEKFRYEPEAGRGRKVEMKNLCSKSGPSVWGRSSTHPVAAWEAQRGVKWPIYLSERFSYK